MNDMNVKQRDCLVVGTSGRKEGERRGEGAVEYDQSMFE
jgi:hypothetical protein